MPLQTQGTTPDNEELPDRGPITVEEFDDVGMIRCEREAEGDNVHQYCKIGERAEYGGNSFPLDGVVGPVTLDVSATDAYHISGGGPATQISADSRIDKGDDRLLSCELKYYFDPQDPESDFSHFKLDC